MVKIILLGLRKLGYGLRVKVILIILQRLLLMFLRMRFLVSRKLMLNYAWFSNRPFTRLWNKFFALVRRVQKFRNMPNYYISMILNVFMKYVKISFMLLRNVLMVQFLSILVKFMIFFMILMNCCLLHPLRLKR